MLIIKTCPFCGHDTSVDMPQDAYDKYEAGELIQNAWPDGTPTEREVVISGICPDCQITTFGGD